MQLLAPGACLADRRPCNRGSTCACGFREGGRVQTQQQHRQQHRLMKKGGHASCASVVPCKTSIATHRLMACMPWCTEGHLNPARSSQYNTTHRWRECFCNLYTLAHYQQRGHMHATPCQLCEATHTCRNLTLHTTALLPSAHERETPTYLSSPSACTLANSLSTALSTACSLLLPTRLLLLSPSS